MRRKEQTVYIGLGSNVGARRHNLAQALELFEAQRVLSEMVASPLYASPALLPKDAPESWDIPFLNQVVQGKTSLSPYELLFALQRIEQSIGRKRRGRWGPREIDLDILCYDTLCVNEEKLQLPHTEMTMRDFVLLPMRDIAPNWVHPVSGRSMAQLVEGLCLVTAALDVPEECDAHALS